MGKITDMLAEVPLSAVLKERLIESEKKIAILETEKAHLKTENANLQERLKKAEEKIRVLEERVKLFESEDRDGYHSF